MLHELFYLVSVQLHYTIGDLILGIISILFIILTYSKMKKSGLVDYVNNSLGKYIPLILVPLLVMFVYACMFLYFYEKEEPVSKNDILTFYGDYISFLGTFCLGYYIFRKGEFNRLNEEVLECEKLLNAIETTRDIIELILDRGYMPKSIEYDINWKSYYLKFEYLIKTENSPLYDTIKTHFKRVRIINSYIINDDYIGVANYYNQCKESDEYSISKYNIEEATRYIKYICMEKRDGIKIENKCLFERKEINDIVDKYAVLYYDLIEEYVYKYMVNNNIESTCNDWLEKEITDWLYEEKKLDGEITKYNDKRLVVKIVVMCFSMIDKKSPRLSYIWGEFMLRNTPNEFEVGADD